MTDGEIAGAIFVGMIIFVVVATILGLILGFGAEVTAFLEGIVVG